MANFCGPQNARVWGRVWVFKSKFRVNSSQMSRLLHQNRCFAKKKWCKHHYNLTRACCWHVWSFTELTFFLLVRTSSKFEHSANFVYCPSMSGTWFNEQSMDSTINRYAPVLIRTPKLTRFEPTREQCGVESIIFTARSQKRVGSCKFDGRSKNMRVFFSHLWKKVVIIRGY